MVEKTILHNGRCKEGIAQKGKSSEGPWKGGVGETTFGISLKRGERRKRRLGQPQVSVRGEGCSPDGRIACRGTLLKRGEST